MLTILPGGAMIHSSIAAFLAASPADPLPAGVVGVLLAPDGWLIRPSLRHLRRLGAAALLAVGPGAADLPSEPGLHRIAADLDGPDDAAVAMNALIDGLAGRWIAWGYGAEFLFYPYCETRSLADIATFLAEERRRALFGYALDLYAPRLPRGGEDPTTAELMLDSAGYHAFPQADQRLDIYGGLGWRFEELMPRALQPIARPGLFLAARGVHLGPSLQFAEADYASIACPWHHNPTGAVMTLRRARALLAHPGFAEVAHRLIWRHSLPFDWTSRQLLERGMIEPGQWF